MKFAKILSVLALAAGVLSFTACSDVTDPKLNPEPDASTFKINVPPLQNEYYKLTESGTFDLTIGGQPDYGFSAITQYRALVSLTEDFAEYKMLTPIGTGTLAKMTFRDNDLAMALTTLHGIESEDQFKDFGEEVVYFRGAAFIDGVENAEGNNYTYLETSNVVTLNRVQSYMALPIPGMLYVVGNYVGAWIGPTDGNEEALAPYALYEKDDEIGSKKYYGTVDFQPTKPEEGSIFRFYTAIGSWEENSLGCAGGTDSDTPVEFPDFKAGSELTHDLAKTKDSFKFNNYTGKIEMFVDLSDDKNPKATFKAVE